MEQFSTLLSVLFFLMILLLVLFLAYVSVKWLGGKSAVGGQSLSHNIKILDRMHLAQDKSLVIVQVANRRLLLSVTSQSIEKIYEFNEEDILDFSEVELGNDFISIFRNALSRTKEDKRL